LLVGRFPIDIRVLGGEEEDEEEEDQERY